jgi:hypothetical protein
MVTPDKLQADAAGEAELHNTNNEKPASTQTQNDESSDEWSDLTSVYSLEKDLTETFLAEIQQNWTITKVEDMIAANTWLKRVGKGDGWDYDTIEAFHRLSILTKGKATEIKTRLASMWGRREKNHGGFTKGIGKDWATKQRNMRQDIGELVKEAKERVSRGSEKGDELEEEEEGAVGEKGTKKTPERNTRSTRRRAIVADVSSPVLDQDALYDQPENTHVVAPQTSAEQVPDSDPLISPSQPIPRPTSPPAPLNHYHTHTHAHSNPTLLKSQLQQSWSLSDPACTDALPTDLRPSLTHGFWHGPIEHWGCEHGCILQELCTLSRKTRGQHEEVIAWLRELVGNATGGRAQGIEIADLRVASEWFRREAREIHIDYADRVNVGSSSHERGEMEMQLSAALSMHRIAEAELGVAKCKRDLAHLEQNVSALELARADRAVGMAEREVAKAWVVVGERKRVFWGLPGRGGGEGE